MGFTRKTNLILYMLFIFCFLISSFHPVSACKDIIACDDATAGDYNLLLKVRDPSRPDYQVLTIVPQGYQYTYHHPWTGKTMSFEFAHKTIGVASVGDTIPNIVKTGMCFTDKGLAFGDADTVSNWKNPTKHAWDDFDWIRYAAQTADSEEEAITLLTEEAVDRLHATAVPENLFLVGPDKGYVIEADVIHHDTTEVNDYTVMSNYAKNLWRKSLFYRSIAPTFDATFEGTVLKGRTIRLGLGSIYGVRILDIGSDSIEVKQIPIQYSKGNIRGRQIDLMSTTRIGLEETKKVGFFAVQLHSIEDRKATVSMCFEYKEWEEIMNKIIQKEYGDIDVSDMMNWSRLHSDDLKGLRGMCDEHVAFRYEGDMIFKIPKTNYDLLSQGWFSANHGCSSIYVPVHICDTDIFEPYETGEAAELSLELLDTYGHGYLSNIFHKTEEVFITELENLQPTIKEIVGSGGNISDFLTISDMSMQKQAYATQHLWSNISMMNENQNIISILDSVWEQNYSFTLQNMKEIVTSNNAISNDLSIVESIVDISCSIVNTRLELCKSRGFSINQAQNEYNNALAEFHDGSYEEGFSLLISSYHYSNALLTKEPNIIVSSHAQNNASETGIFVQFFFILIILVGITFLFLGIKHGLNIEK